MDQYDKDSAETKRALKAMKMPAGTNFNPDGASWYKSGGHAGKKAILRVIENITAAGWKRKTSISTSTPDASHVGSANTYVDATGTWEASFSSSYGSTKSDNYFGITVRRA